MMKSSTQGPSNGPVPPLLWHMLKANFMRIALVSDPSGTSLKDS